MTSKVKKETATLKKSTQKKIPTGEEIAQFAKVCAENKISQLIIPDFCSIVMHDFAFYHQDLGPIPNGGTDFPTTIEDDEAIMKDDILFASART